MKRALLFFVPMLLSSCTPESGLKPGLYGGDGTSRAQAVVAVFRGDRQDSDLVTGQWLERHYPGCFLKAVFNPPEGLPSDFRIYRVRQRDGKFINVWFKLICLHCPVIT